MADMRRFIAQSWLRAWANSVWSEPRGGDSRSRRVRRLANAMRRHPEELAIQQKLTLKTLNWRSRMTLMKSILLGSAAGIVAVASAQAADLPTRKAAPVEYVKVCNVGGSTGSTLPSSDTCVKFSGYMTAQVEGGNLNTQYNYGSIGTADAA